MELVHIDHCPVIQVLYAKLLGGFPVLHVMLYHLGWWEGEGQSCLLECIYHLSNTIISIVHTRPSADWLLGMYAYLATNRNDHLPHKRR